MEKERPVGKSSSMFNLLTPTNLEEINAGFINVGEYMATEDNTSIMQSTFEPIDMNPSDEAKKEEVEWLKTQDRMVPIPADIYKFDKKIFVLKKRIHPSNRLCPKPETVVTSVSQCNAPDPFDEKELHSMTPFGSDNTYKLQKLSRNGIVEKGEEDMRNTKRDYEGYRAKKEIQANWSTALLTDKMRKLDSDDQRVSCIRVQIDSTFTDPLGRFSVYAPAFGWYSEEAYFKNTVALQARYPILTDIISLRGLGSNYFCRIQNGLNTFIDNIAHQEKNRVLFIDQREREELCDYIGKEFSSVHAVRQLSHTEYKFIFKNCRDLQMRNPDPSTTNAYELTFGNSKDIPISMLSANNSMMFPTPIETKFNLCEREIIGLKLSWQPYPSMCQGQIILKSPKNVAFCQWVLTHNSVCCTGTVRRLHPDNRTVAISLDRSEYDSYDDKTVEYMLERLLKANNIEYETITLFRHTDNSRGYLALKNLIHQRIGRAAVNCGLWESAPNEPIPGYDDEWFRYIEKYEYTLPWRIYLDPYDSPFEADKRVHGNGNFRLYKGDPRLAKERGAVVIFEDQNYALNIINYIPEKPSWEFMSFSKNDTRGVSFRPFFTIRRQVPSFVRAVIDEFIRQEDTTMRQNSNLKKGSWCQYADDNISEHVLVEGWPINLVKKAAEKLDEQLNGITMDCSEPEGNGRLLHGVGLAYLNKIQNQQKGKVVVALYQLEKRIHIIGNMQECLETKNLLSKFSTNRDKFLVRAAISLKQPRFMRFISEKICDMVYKKYSELRSSIDFSTLVVNKNGTELGLQCKVEQYERFQELLDKIQTDTLDFYKDKIHVAMDIKFEKVICPLCMSPVLYACCRLKLCGHLYCLDCFRQMILFHLKNRELPIQCQYEKKGFKCIDTIALADIMQMFFDDNFIYYPNFFKDRLDLLVAATTDFAVKKNRGMLRYCTVPDCPGIIFKSPASVKFQQCKCGVCGFKVCSKCFYPLHHGVTCEIETANQESVDASIKYYMSNKKDNVKRCPTSNCQGVIEKDAGCNHVQCSFCKNHFCWICNYQSSDQAQIYKHMGFVHGGFGGGWEHLDRREGFQPAAVHGPVGLDGFPEWIVINGHRVDMDLP